MQIIKGSTQTDVRELRLKPSIKSNEILWVQLSNCKLIETAFVLRRGMCTFIKNNNNKIMMNGYIEVEA